MSGQTQHVLVKSSNLPDQCPMTGANLQTCTTSRVIMPFRRSCHMPFHKLIPLFTLTAFLMPNFRVSIPQQRDITVSLETKSIILYHTPTFCGIHTELISHPALKCFRILDEKRYLFAKP